MPCPYDRLGPNPDYSWGWVMGREGVPPALVGVAGGEAQADPVEPLADPAADLDQAQPQRRQGHAGDPGPVQPPPQRVEQPVGGGVEQQPERTGWPRTGGN